MKALVKKYTFSSILPFISSKKHFYYKSYLMLDFEQLEEVKEFVENCYQVAHVFNCNHLRKTELWQSIRFS
jgi:tRNA G26 N,N-dimethylase Trm1